MSGAPGILTTVFAFLLVLGPLVLVHELGHYLVGRWMGVGADAFSIGFGREIAGWTDRRGTRWKLSILPLGGYVQFAGDRDAMSSPDETARAVPGSFAGKPLWQRALIVLAGPLTNLIVAVLVFAAFNYAYGKPVAQPVVADFAAGSSAQAAGIRVGDRIIAIDGEKLDTIADYPEQVRPYPGDEVSVTVDRGGRELVVPLRIGERELTDQFGNSARIGTLGIDFATPEIGRVLPGSPAEAAGLRADDRIVEIDGAKITSFEQIPALILPRPDSTVSLTVLRGTQTFRLPVRVGAIEQPSGDGKMQRVGRLGIEAAVARSVPVGPVEAVSLGFEQSFAMMRMMSAGLGQIITGQRSVKELGGPIKIAQYSGQQFSLGWEDFVSFVAMISINLAFINLLPIPGLDGGHLAFYAAEAVRRRPLGARSQEWAIRTGVALVLTLMLLVTVNDLASLRIFGG